MAGSDGIEVRGFLCQPSNPFVGHKSGILKNLKTWRVKAHRCRQHLWDPMDHHGNLSLQYLGLYEQREQTPIARDRRPIGVNRCAQSGNIEAAFFNGAMGEELRSKGFRILTHLYAANLKTLGSGVIVRKGLPAKKSRADDKRAASSDRRLAFVKSPMHKAKRQNAHAAFEDQRSCGRRPRLSLSAARSGHHPFPPVEGLQTCNDS